ncbi:Uncharacterised protein [BD1-7 clade bacterium]|uniref:Type VI secretion system contractile sheath small subunit n=1 Tax=BD1-7 clade bacterium TaxID=2029982 RepID=A0A5S9QUV8_9GAMM|nr:Uncharacterised protein [BD1-7 clade bacterium]
MSGQKFLARNRPPRVQIEYDVELYGSEKTVQVPFIMGVLSDLSGKSEVELPPIHERDFVEFNIDNFNDRLQSIAPKVSFDVPNRLSDEGDNFHVEMTFSQMEDFSPYAIAKKVPGLDKLMEARQNLANLLTYMDGKAGAEELISQVLDDPELLKSLAAKAKTEHAAEGE